jgi:hypothetical protein
VTRPNADARLTLADGRVLTYCEWGDLAGLPVILFHGAPGSRLFSPQPRVTRELGVRLVTFDRPGYGGSDRREGREFVDTPDDVTQLADRLGIDRFAVVSPGSSSGTAPRTPAVSLTSSIWLQPSPIPEPRPGPSRGIWESCRAGETCWKRC